MRSKCPRFQRSLLFALLVGLALCVFFEFSELEIHLKADLRLAQQLVDALRAADLESCDAWPTENTYDEEAEDGSELVLVTTREEYGHFQEICSAWWIRREFSKFVETQPSDSSELFEAWCLDDSATLWWVSKQSADWRDRAVSQSAVDDACVEKVSQILAYLRQREASEASVPSEDCHLIHKVMALGAEASKDAVSELHRLAALAWLRSAQAQPTSLSLRHFRGHLASADWAPDDAGTSEEELAELRLRVQKEAEVALAGQLAGAGRSGDSKGTSEKGVDGLRLQVLRKLAEDALSRVRRIFVGGGLYDSWNPPAEGCEMLRELFTALDEADLGLDELNSHDQLVELSEKILDSREIFGFSCAPPSWEEVGGRFGEAGIALHLVPATGTG